MFTVWEVLAIVALSGLLSGGNGFLVGWLVYRAKREPHEYLSPPSLSRSADTGRAVNIDDLAREDFPDPGLPASMKAASALADSAIQQEIFLRAEEQVRAEKGGKL